MYLKINGKTHYLWRAVDQHGNVLDILVQSRRNTHAAKRFFRKLLKGLQYAPRVIITDKLKSYGAAKREILPGVEHRQHKGLNNRAENSHQPTRLREKKMRRFRISPRRYSAFFRPSASLLVISNPEGIVYVPRNTVPFYKVDFRPGMRSPKQKLRHSTV